MAEIQMVLALVISTIMVGGKLIKPIPGKNITTVLPIDDFLHLQKYGAVERYNPEPNDTGADDSGGSKPQEAAPGKDAQTTNDENASATGTLSPDSNPDNNAEKTLREAIGQLDRDDEDLFTDDGKPKVNVLEDALGVKITAVDRDVAWDLYQQQNKPDNDQTET